MSQKLIAEALGTLILVLFGCGSAVLMGAQIGMLGISLAFGLAIVAAAYGLRAIHYACTYALKVPPLSGGMLGIRARSYNSFTKDSRAVVQIPE